MWKKEKKESNLLSDSHVLFGCRILDSVREAQGISEFVRSARRSGLDEELTYKFYVSGRDIDGKYVGHKARGTAIAIMGGC